MKKHAFLSVLVLLVAIALSLVACGETPDTPVTLDTLTSEYGAKVEGGKFAEGSVLICDAVDVSTEEGAAVLSAMESQSYNLDAPLKIFDIHIEKDGASVQPDGKVTVTIPMGEAGADGYVLFLVVNNKASQITPVMEDGNLSFETDTFGTFVIAEAAPEVHTHAYVWVEGTLATCTEEGIAPHYHCDGCDTDFDENYGEVTSLTLPKTDHEYGSEYWAKSPNFWEDGNIEYYQCAVCEKYFDKEYNEVATVVIPRYATNLSILVNGTPTALVLVEQHENYIEWSLEGLSVTKGDVITICQTDNAEIVHAYFAEGNVDTDGKILTTAEAANVVLTATPNGLMLFIDGYKYEGVVIEINGVQYPMIDTAYPDETTTYIYGYVHFEAGDTFVIVDTVSGTVYDYDDLDEEYLWDTWDFHRGENGEFVIDYACRYGIEFDLGGNQEIYINKTFAPLDGSAYELTFENTDAASAELVQMQIETGSEAYEDLMWYYDHEDVVNKEDIVSYINAKGIYVYTAILELEEGTKFNVKNLTADSTIGADHLAEVYAESGSITREGDYVKVLKSGSYSIVYLPCFNSFMIEKAEGSADVLMMLDGEFIYLNKDSDGMVSYENFTAEFNTSITFMSGDGLSYYPIILDSETDSSLLRTYEANGISVVYFMKAGTYRLTYNVETGVLSVSGTSQEPDPSVTYYYYLALVDYTNGNRSDQLSPSASDPTVYRIDGVLIAKGSFLRITVLGSDGSDASYYTLKDTDAAIATEFAEMILFSKEGTYDILFDSVGKTVTLILAE